MLLSKRVASAAVLLLAAGTVTIPPTSAAIAAGSPNITLVKSAPAEALIGSAIPYTLTASNANGNPAGYNLLVRDVLPVGVSYVAGSTVPAWASWLQASPSPVSPAEALIGSAIPYTLTASNANGNPAGYNLLVRDVLPVGVSYVAGSTVPADEGRWLVSSWRRPRGATRTPAPTTSGCWGSA